MPLPRPCLQFDLVIATPWSTRRNRFYYEATIYPPGLTELEHCCNALLDHIADPLVPLLTNQCKVQAVEGRYFGPGTTGFEANSTNPGVAGQLIAVTPNSGTDATSSTTADTLPDESVLIVQKRTGNTGRAQMGRWFFSGLGEYVQNAGQIDVEALANVKAFANVLSTSVNVSGAFATVMNARHFNQKASTLMPITKCYAVRTLGTRKDRRRPLKLERA